MVQHALCLPASTHNGLPASFAPASTTQDVPHTWRTVQACAQENLGEKPMTYPEFYKQPANMQDPMPTGLGSSAARFLFEPGAQPRFWKREYCNNQWHVDAFTCDPRVVCKRFRGIRFKKMPLPVAQRPELNASVGQMPCMLVYIATHAKYGTRIFYPYLGTSGGAAKYNTWEGYQYWGHNITKEELVHLQRCAYYNQPPARARARQLMATLDPDMLHPKLFRVRALHCHTLRYTLMSSICRGHLCFS